MFVWTVIDFFKLSQREERKNICPIRVVGLAANMRKLCVSYCFLNLLGDCLIVVECVRSRTRGLSFNDSNFHMLDLDPHKKKVDLADNHVFEMVSEGKLTLC